MTMSVEAATIVSECRSSIICDSVRGQHERLRGEHERREDHRAAAQAEDAEPGQHQHFQQQAKDAAQKQQDFQPLGGAD